MRISYILPFVLSSILTPSRRATSAEWERWAAMTDLEHETAHDLIRRLGRNWGRTIYTKAELERLIRLRVREDSWNQRQSTAWKQARLSGGSISDCQRAATKAADRWQQVNGLRVQPSTADLLLCGC